MPKNIVEPLVQRMIRDIGVKYRPGDRYLSLAQIAQHYAVSYTSAFKAVRALVERNLLESRQRSGIRVTNTRPSLTTRGKKIVVYSANLHDEVFNQAFLTGAQDIASEHGVGASLALHDGTTDERSIAIGESILRLPADGVIALAFSQAALGFYHAMSRGMDLVTDVPMPELPQLPVVHTDNFGNGVRAATLMREQGYRVALLGTLTDENIFRGFFSQRIEGFRSVAAACGMEVVCANVFSSQGNGVIERFFSRFGRDHAVFSVESQCNKMLAARFHAHNIKVRADNFLVYDGPSDFFLYRGLPPVALAGPSFRVLGRNLARKLIAKWETGSFAEPLCEGVTG